MLLFTVAFWIHGIWLAYEIEPFTYIFESFDIGSKLLRIAWSKDDFPLPTSPIIQMNSDFFIERFMFFNFTFWAIDSSMLL